MACTGTFTTLYTILTMVTYFTNAMLFAGKCALNISIGLCHINVHRITVKTAIIRMIFIHEGGVFMRNNDNLEIEFSSSNTLGFPDLPVVPAVDLPENWKSSQ